MLFSMHRWRLFVEIIMHKKLFRVNDNYYISS